MIEIKSEREIALLKEAGRIVALCHEEMKKMVKPGISTYELNEICEKIILSLLILELIIRDIMEILLGLMLLVKSVKLMNY